MLKSFCFICLQKQIFFSWSHQLVWDSHTQTQALILKILATKGQVYIISSIIVTFTDTDLIGHAHLM